MHFHSLCNNMSTLHSRFTIEVTTILPPAPPIVSRIIAHLRVRAHPFDDLHAYYKWPLHVSAHYCISSAHGYLVGRIRYSHNSTVHWPSVLLNCTLTGDLSPVLANCWWCGEVWGVHCHYSGRSRLWRIHAACLLCGWSWGITTAQLRAWV